MSSSTGNGGQTGAASGPPASASQLVSTLIPVLIVAALWSVAFLVLRPRFARNYSPRTQSRMLQKDEFSEPLPTSMFGWIKPFFAVPDEHVLTHQSMDAYFFLRLLKMSVVICLVCCIITWPILFPIYATGGGGSTQLNVITFGNVANPFKYFATIICMYLIFFFIFVVIYREMVYYVNLRQAYLMNPAYASKLPSRTVLYTAVPPAYLNEGKIRQLLGPEVKHVWFPTDDSDLQDLVDERQKAAMTLEGGETKLIIAANEARLKSFKKNGAPADTETGHAGADRWVQSKDRPTTRTGLLGLIGKKVDSIYWGREEIARLTPIIEEQQAKHRAADAKLSGAVFVEFATLAGAQAACQSLTHHQMLKMSPRWTGMNPAEVIWKNLRIKGPERFVRVWVTTAIVIALIIFWTIPVAFIGVISNINYWIGPNGKTPWLNFLTKVPSVVFGVITGLLPTILLAVLMALLPIFLRFMAKMSGSPTLADVEYKVSNYYFGFQVVQVFLITTFSSAVSGSVFNIISHPSQAPTLLAQGLPTANGFYLSYIILQGLGVVSGMLAGLTGLILTPILIKFLGKTPRKIFKYTAGLKLISYGTVYPIYLNLLVIAISYSVIAPLVTGFAAIGLYLFYFAYRYNIMYVYGTGPDTKGLLYARAMSQLFIGLYIAVICLIGLFGINLGKNAKAAIGPFILSIILLVITALFQIALRSAMAPLLYGLPKTLDAEERTLAKMTTNGTDPEKLNDGVADAVLAPKKPKPSMIKKFLRPDIYCDYATMRRLMPLEITSELDESQNAVDVRDAYLPPAVWAELPRLILPRDPAGISGPEVIETGKVCPVTDAGATLNEKNKMVLDEDKMSELYFKEKSRHMERALNMSIPTAFAAGAS